MLIPILFQNASLLAVNKAPGVSVHNAEDPENLLLLLERQLKRRHLFPVHRLDKETSGIQILALTSESAANLAEEFRERSVKKNYVGILRGQLEQREGVWDRPLTDKAEGRKNPEGLSRDRIPCETKYRVLKESKYFTYCEFDLITGRQHQIRKHSTLAKHHLVGDTRYGDPKYNQRMAGMYKTDRMFLHCTRIELLGHRIECPPASIFEQLMTGTQ